MVSCLLMPVQRLVDLVVVWFEPRVAAQLPVTITVLATLVLDSELPPVVWLVGQPAIQLPIDATFSTMRSR